MMRRRYLLILLLAVLTFGLYGWRVIDRNPTVATAASAAINEARAAHELPQALDWLREERDTEIVAAKLSLAKAGQSLLDAVRSYERELRRYEIDVSGYEKYGRVQDMLGIPQPLPRSIDHVRHRSDIKAVFNDFEAAVRRFDAELQRIECRYKHELAHLTSDVGDDEREIPLLPASCDTVIKDALKTAQNIDAILHAMIEGHQARLKRR